MTLKPNIVSMMAMPGKVIIGQKVVMPDERQAGDHHDIGPDTERGIHDQGRERIGQDLSDDDAEVPRSPGPGRLNIFLISDGEHSRP